VDPHILLEEIRKRTLNVTIVYPPTLASEFQVSQSQPHAIQQDVCLIWNDVRVFS
jgi:hypothetical protein